MWNEPTSERRQLFFEGKLTEEAMEEIWKKSRKKLNADLKAASNTAHRAGYKVTIKKVESYRVTHSGVKPTTPLRRGQAETPAVKPSP